MTIIDDVANALLAETLTQITISGAETPGRACVVPGELAWDDCECGLLSVRLTSTGFSRSFPTIVPDMDTDCGTPYFILGFNVTLLRCIAGTQRAGTPPTCAQLSNAAETLHQDMIILETAMANVVVDLVDSNVITAFALNGQVPTGPQGRCVGTQYTLSVGVRNTWRPC